MNSSFLWRNRVLLTSGLLLLLSAHMLTTGVGPRDPAARPGEVLLGVLSPVQDASAHLVDSTHDFWHDYLDLVRVQRENQRLHTELSRFQNEQARLDELETENRHLSELLELRETLGMRAIAANVIGSDATGLSRTLILSAGANNGLNVGMAVLSNQGVVGKLIATSGSSSRVLLIDDHNAALDAFDQRSRVRGIVAGVVDDGLTMKYVGRTADVRVGDAVVTSGLDGTFPRGLLVGEVSRVESQGPGLFVNVSVAPAVDFRRLEQVLVVTDPPPRIIAQDQD
ncbi:MAG TPA: rod shape-determining protein MreC [Candidatus Binataceae bacterium]|nr:rod shape-determining protein MreC [Candidatus Binataceae bacterium]